MESISFTIQWEAIGGILTGVGLIFACWSIYTTKKQNKKNRDLEIKIRQQENEQKWLDEYTQTVQKMYALIRIKEMYSRAYIIYSSDSYRTKDIRYFTNLSLKFNEFLHELYLKQNKVTSNKNSIIIQNNLEKINKYLIDFHYKFTKLRSKDSKETMLPVLMEDIKNLQNDTLTEYCTKTESEDLDSNSYLRCLLSDFCILRCNEIYMLTRQILENMSTYVNNEQKRINNILKDLESSDNK